jgi:hypothetical protein
MFNPFKKKQVDGPLAVDKIPLPLIPEHWKPDSISLAEKREDMVRIAKESENVAFSKDDEDYWTASEIQIRNKWKESNDQLWKRIRKTRIGEFTGKNFKHLTDQEIRNAAQSLGINDLTGLVNRPGEGLKRQRHRPQGLNLNPGGQDASAVAGAGDHTVGNGTGNKRPADGEAREKKKQKRARFVDMEDEDEDDGL